MCLDMFPAQKLDDQCFYDLACSYSDENSVCTQINHNAICQCKEGFHAVTHSKPTRRTFCTQSNLLSIDSLLRSLYGFNSFRFIAYRLGPADLTRRNNRHCSACRTHLHGAALVQQDKVSAHATLCRRTQWTAGDVRKRYRYG